MVYLEDFRIPPLTSPLNSSGIIFALVDYCTAHFERLYLATIKHIQSTRAYIIPSIAHLSRAGFSDNEKN